MLGDGILKELCYEITLSLSISYGTTSLSTSLIGAFIHHPLTQAYADYLPLLSACFESKYWEETIVGSYVAFLSIASSAVVFLCA